MEKPLQVFCCYAREDQPFLLTLKKHLRPIQREGLINVQADIDVSPGEEWEQKVSHYLNTAQIILLLISPDFIDSDYCYSKEMIQAMERHERREARVIPIILRPTRWQGALFGKLQVLPTNAEPVTSKAWHTIDDAFFDIAQGIEKVVDKFLEETVESLLYPLPISETTSKIKIVASQDGDMEQKNTDPSIARFQAEVLKLQQADVVDVTKKAKQDALNKEGIAALLEIYKGKIDEAKKESFTFLLVGRTGVGKSSSVNSLMGREVAPIGNWEPTTMSIHSYDNEAFGIKFRIIDTPGLCDDLEEENKDYIYLKRIQDGVPQFDCLWFVTPLDETRIRADEKRAIKLIGQAFGKDVWRHAIIVFTFSNNTRPGVFQEAFKTRTELIRTEIARWTGASWAGASVATKIPAVAIDNKAKTTPDGKEWLGELYMMVFTHISDHGFLPFLLATESRLSFVESKDP